MTEVRKAVLDDSTDIAGLIDGEFTKEGFGFVNREQIKTEIGRGNVLVATEDESIVGVRIGLVTMWNLVVTKSKRGKGIGRMLVEYHRPITIRVKSDPVGHLSKAQRESFVDPTEFYETLGYKFGGRAYSRNFWQRGKDGKGQFHKQGDTAHIKVYKDDGSTLFD
jgi:GNAT superfamily N-acetyltransferase